MSTTIVTGKEIEKLRRRADRAARVRTAGLPEGWSTCRADPMRVVAVFASLQVHAGYVLRAYQYHWRGNGNGWVWALPAADEFPQPGDYEPRSGRSLDVPRPPRALDDPMQVISGDGSPRSYIEASLLARQLAEIGALGRGCDWSTHEVLDSDPTAQRGGAWHWQGRRPADWRPRVVNSAAGTRVVFQTYSALGREVVYRHADTYAADSYIHTSRTTKLATAGRII